MKKLIFIIAFVFSCLMSVFAQTKNDNKIMISGYPDTLNIKNACMQAFIQNNYIIKLSEANLIVATRNIPKINGTATIQVYIADTSIQLTGSAESTGSTVIIRNFGMNGSPLLESWKLMNSLALSISNQLQGTLTYLKN